MRDSVPSRDIQPFVMYCDNGKPRSSLLIESTDYDIPAGQYGCRGYVFNLIQDCHLELARCNCCKKDSSNQQYKQPIDWKCYYTC